MTIDPHGSVGASSTKGPKTADAYGKGNHPIAGSPQSRLVLERLEPYDGKLSSTVPRGAWAGDRPGATRWLTPRTYGHTLSPGCSPFGYRLVNLAWRGLSPLWSRHSRAHERGIYSALARRLAIRRNKFRVPTQHHSSHPETSEMRTLLVSADGHSALVGCG
jgi:hypothetical protein